MDGSDFQIFISSDLGQNPHNYTPVFNEPNKSDRNFYRI